MSVLARFFAAVIFFLFLVPGHLCAITYVDYLIDGDQAFSKYISQQPFIIEKLIVHADVTIDYDNFLYLTGLKEGVSVDALALSCACFYLKNSGQWQSIKLEIESLDRMQADINAGEHKIIKFFLKKNWLVSAVRVNGLWFGKEVIKHRYLIKTGEVFDQNKHDESLRVLQVFFKKMGYWHAQITSKITRNERDKTVKIYLHVHKGPRYSIRDVVIASVGSHKLLSRVKQAAQKEARLLLKNHFYSARAVTRYIQFVRKLLVYHYMPCAQVSVNVVHKRHNALVIQVNIDCLPNNKVTITGNTHFTYEKLIDELFQEDQQARFLSVPFLVHAITLYYREHGFLNVQIDLQKRKTDWLININEGVQQQDTNLQEPDHILSVSDHEPLAQKVLFGKTIIAGAWPVRTQRLMRLLDYQEETPFDVIKLHKTFDRISNLGVFESVRVFPLAEHDVYGRVPMIVAVDTGDPFEAQLRVGVVGTNTLSFGTYTIGGSFLAKNITHNADTLTINAEITRFCRDISAAYRYPCIAGFPVSITIPVYDKKTEVIGVGTNSCVLYTASQRGLGFYSEFRNDKMRFMLNTGFDATKITNLCESVAKAILFKPQLRDRYISYAYFEPSFYFDSLDDPFNPRTGSSARIYVRCMGALHARSASFARLLAEQSFFIPCFRAITGAVRVRAGYIFCPSFLSLVPSERFYLGGSSSIRAYQQDNMAPLACCENSGQNFWAPIGSRMVLSATVEARVTVKNTIGLVFFQDVGVLRDERTADWCAGGATGIGVRYITPIGPLRFDIGFKNKKMPNDRLPLAWFLTIGQAF